MITDKSVREAIKYFKMTREWVRDDKYVLKSVPKNIDTAIAVMEQYLAARERVKSALSDHAKHLKARIEFEKARRNERRKTHSKS